MTRLEQLSWARPALFFVYVVETAMALGPALFGSSALEPAFTPGGRDAYSPNTTTLMPTLVSVAATLVIYAAASPLLEATLVRALSGDSLGQALRVAPRLYLASLSVSIRLAAPALGGVALAAGAPWGAWHLLEGVLPEPAVDIFTLLVALPGLYVLGRWAAAHDIARVALSAREFEPNEAATVGRRVANARASARWLAWALGGASAQLAGTACGAALAGDSLWRLALALVAAELCAGGRILMRATWLAECADRVGAARPRTPPARAR